MDPELAARVEARDVLVLLETFAFPLLINLLDIRSVFLHASFRLFNKDGHIQKNTVYFNECIVHMVSSSEPGEQ